MGIVDVEESRLDPVKEGILCANCMILIKEDLQPHKGHAIFGDWRTETKEIIIIKTPPGHKRLCSICSIDENELCDGFISLSNQVNQELHKDWKNAGRKKKIS